MTVLIDSNLWIEYLEDSGRSAHVAEYIEGKDTTIISTINVAEVFRHVLKVKDKKSAELALKIMLSYSFAIPVSMSIAVFAATVKHEHKLGLGDAVIYATAQAQQAILVTGDADFKKLKDVIYIEK